MMTNKIDVIAFYLPQYHPTKENNEWYGKGFTEWTNVGKAKPLFRGHYQPKVPADLGYYDLRVPQVRQQQADLAKEAGISAFCYYHYWFGNGRELLSMPLREVVHTKQPDFPFCICWANHTWYNKTWNAERNILDKRPIMLQEYLGQADWKAHFYSLLDTFRDQRYYKIDGKLVFVLYHTAEIPNADLFMNYWQDLAQREGLPGFYFMSYVDDMADAHNPAHKLCEKTILSCKSNIESVGSSKHFRKFSRALRVLLAQSLNMPLNVYNYADVRKWLIDIAYQDDNIVPVLLPNWDNTPRRGNGALILDNATPKQFYLHCKDVFELIRNKQQKIVFLKSWNEWGEGNYMEPCLKYGHGYINALRQALSEE